MKNMSFKKYDINMDTLDWKDKLANMKDAERDHKAKQAKSLHERFVWFMLVKFAKIWANDYMEKEQKFKFNDELGDVVYVTMQRKDI